MEGNWRGKSINEYIQNKKDRLINLSIIWIIRLESGLQDSVLRLSAPKSLGSIPFNCNLK